jgi:uncharacterized protein YjbI with pentapeptide repeats
MNFSELSFDNKKFFNLVCPKQDFRQKEFVNCVFKKCDFSEANFSEAVFIDCSFIDCNLSNIKITNSSWQGVVVDGCKLTGIVFSEVSTLLINWSFKKCLMDFCDFNKLEIKGSKFIACDIKETNFTNCNLAQADFSESSLSGSKFVNNNLEKADFSGAKNYYIDPTANKIKGAIFSYPEALSLLGGFEINLKY